VGWGGMGWDGMGGDGRGWDGRGWDGMGWDGWGWDGMGWGGMGWDGIIVVCCVRVVVQRPFFFVFVERKSCIVDFIPVLSLSLKSQFDLLTTCYNRHN
jgi:hypothetical protein